jgi:hypothetical protein
LQVVCQFISFFVGARRQAGKLQLKKDRSTEQKKKRKWKVSRHAQKKDSEVILTQQMEVE